MTLNLLTSFLAVSAACCLTLPLASCNAKGHDAAGHHHNEQEEQAQAHDEGAHNHDEITLEPEMAEKFGVEASTAVPSDFRSVITVSGQIVDSPNSSAIVAAPTAGIVRFAPGVSQGSQASAGMTIATISAAQISGGDANAVAKATLDAAKKELDRVAPLHADGIVSTKDYNAALQAYQQAKAAYSAAAASGKATAPKSGVITSLMAQQGQYVNAGDPIATISSTTNLTLRADLPEKHYALMPQLTSANIQTPYAIDWISLESLGAKRVSGPTSVSAQRGYVPIYFDFANDGSFIPGSYVNVKLLGEPRKGVISVPVAAVSEQQGAYFVYERLDEDCYRKIPVKTGMSDGINVEIVQGLSGGENIVGQGMVAVRLAETSGVAPEGHSHNH